MHVRNVNLKVQKAWMFSGLLLLAFSFLSPAFAQTDRDTLNRINRIENEIETLNRAVYRGETPPPGSYSGSSNAGASADIEVRLQQLETEIRNIRGEVERANFEAQQVKNQLERITSDMELRIQDLENGRSGSASGSSSSRTQVPYTTSTPRPAPDDQRSDAGTGANAAAGGFEWSSNNGVSEDGNTGGQLGSYVVNRNGGNQPQAGALATATYDNAFSLVKNRQYDSAQVEFETFLRDYPDHPLAGNAKYWLGETHYVRGDYAASARIFAEGYQKYPEGAKAADNLLKLGLSLDALGKKDDACIALQQLQKENPSGAAPVMRRAEQEMSRIGCS